MTDDEKDKKKEKKYFEYDEKELEQKGKDTVIIHPGKKDLVEKIINIRKTPF